MGLVKFKVCICETFFSTLLTKVIFHLGLFIQQSSPTPMQTTPRFDIPHVMSEQITRMLLCLLGSVSFDDHCYRLHQVPS